MLTTRMKLLRYTVLTAGLLGMTLRAFLYAAAMDHKGLLAADHWATWSILGLTGLVLVLLLFLIRHIHGPDGYAQCYPASFLQGAGSLAAALAIAGRSLFLYPAARDALDQAAAISGFMASGGLLLVCCCRLSGKKPIFLCHSAVSIFFALQMVSQYRVWSADPQLMDYGFYLAALICLMLSSYFLASFDADMPKFRALWFFSMMSAFFCLLALPESGDATLLMACALWTFTCIPRTAPHSRRRPAMDPSQEASDDHS